MSVAAPGSLPRVGMAMIVRDEAHIIADCIRSFAGHVDVLAIVDTGSTDGTLDVAVATLQEHLEHAARDPEGRLRGTELRVAEFAWIDDFAAARTAADELLGDCDWLAWIDADDELAGAPNLRALAANAPADVAAYGAGYDYLQGPGGECVCYLRRERLVRRGHGEWRGRVHEAQHITGGRIEWLPADVIEWRHRKPAASAGTSGPRNRRILEAWVADEPDNPRIISYLGTELAAAGDVDGAVGWFERYLQLPTDWPEERAQVHRKLAMCLLEDGQVDAAVDQGMQAMRVHPEWPDNALTLAEAHYRLGEWEHAAHWARRVLEHGAPDTLLIVNPLDYTFQPRLILAGALGEQGQLQQAIDVATAADRAVPGDPRISGALATWRGRLKRDETAAAVIAAAQVLVGHDEQAKALILLEQAVPHFVVDHPDVVACRSQLRERLLFVTDPAAYEEHYVEGGSKPEDFCDDQRALELAEHLPRAHFLHQGLLEQQAERTRP